MKRAIAVALALGLLAGAFVGPAEAGKKKKKKKPVRVERVVEHEYTKPSPGVPGVASACLASQDPEAGCVNIALGTGEKYVSVKLEDSSGQQPYWILAQDTDTETPGYDIFHNGCGDSEEPIEITEGLELRVSVYAFGGPACPAVATTGKITATLSNLP